MGFHDGAFAKVFVVEPKTATITKARIGISVKNKKTDEYKTEFEGYVSFMGADCAKRACKLNEGDRIKLLRTDHIRIYDRETKKTYTEEKVFDFEMAFSENKPVGVSDKENAKKPVSQNNVEGNDVESKEGDRLPF